MTTPTEESTEMQGEGNKRADRRYREEATAFSSDFDPEDLSRLERMARLTKQRIDTTIERLSETADQRILEGRRKLARALTDLGQRLDEER